MNSWEKPVGYYFNRLLLWEYIVSELKNGGLENLGENPRNQRSLGHVLRAGSGRKRRDVFEISNETQGFLSELEFAEDS